MKIKQKYEEMQKKYKLPSYTEINNDFEIIGIEEDDFLLRNIRRKIVEKLDAYAKIIEPVLMPESNLQGMYECQVFTEDEKKDIYNMFKKMIYFDRFSAQTSINEDDKKTAAFLNEFWKEWGAMKQELEKAFKILTDGWTKEIKLKEESSYLG